ncbi:MAG: class I SAM-dependent methyltransferase [Kordiimonadaceae bacterium]|jgi:predicted methyltransferase|nr:class I SAM-dependent methyltransferase [Kordiimonadaceae bacterium]MBT6033107.1 class I SAM-dependent methyltransferase [Kordiimonadaceae bacterium]
MKIKMLQSAIMCVAISIIPINSSQADDYDDLIKAAMDNPARAEANSSRDAARMPGQVIKFMGVQPGMTVLDMVSNGGFYAEILAGVVGDDGRVIAHMFANAGMDPDNAYAKYIRDTDHMSNVVPIYAGFNDLDVKENTLDAVFLIQNFHDFYFDRFGVDVQEVLAMYRKALKPGGIMAVIDHEAMDGAPSSTGTIVHRIDSAVVKKDMSEAGFMLAGELDILKNTTDDKSKLVFDPAVRGKTSRFILKFTNP